jgi:asparagine synthase (glutamine-hydrolysing)
MCGVAGYFYRNHEKRVDETIVTKMVRILHHRGPDEEGYYCKDNIGMGMRRLSIIDLSGGTQPIHNEDKTIWVVFNGEIFNYIELREELIKKGHRFYTHSDTEVIVHAYEEYGVDCVKKFNGQFGISLWDDNKKRLMLARDRVGIRPLFYAIKDDMIIYGSEIKSIFQYPGFEKKFSARGLEQIFTLWVNVPPDTPFEGVSELAPGHLMLIDESNVKTIQWWKLSFPDQNAYENKPLSYYTDRTHELLYDSTTLRLRADVPVAAYLSGGLDSSIITSLVKKYHNNDLITFSVCFKDKEFDERSYQQTMIDYLKTDHRFIEVNHETIGNTFTDVVYFSEKPMIRTAPAPLFSLAKLVRDNDIKVVLTGEGADEMFGGYNIFKEDRIRRFWARQLDSKIRPKLLQKIYPYINRNAPAFWEAFFKKGISDINNPYYSHLIRWNNMTFIKNLFSDDIISKFNIQENVFEPLNNYIDKDITRWHPLCRAQYLEIVLFMSGYLLSSQGDRMMMGNSIEGRFPFLDYRVMEFATTIPPKYKLNSLNEKYILKKAFESYVPESVVKRAKHPYRAPIASCFIDPGTSNRGATLLTPEKISEKNIFNVEKVGRYLQKLKTQPVDSISERDEMAIAGIVSTQLLSDLFI